MLLCSWLEREDTRQADRNNCWTYRSLVAGLPDGDFSTNFRISGFLKPYDPFFKFIYFSKIIHLSRIYQ